MLKLVIADDEGNTTAVALARDEITIGRREGNTIRLTDRNVSRQHCRLERVVGAFVLHDAGSYAGTLVNGVRLTGPHTLVDGDQIRIGDYQLAVTSGVSEMSIPPASAAAYRGSAPPAIGGLRIVFLGPAGVPEPVPLDRLPIVLGRADTCDVPLAFASISREHVRLSTDGANLLIEDLGSANGLTVNGERMPSATLEVGDLVSLGEVEFRIARRDDDTVLIQRPTQPAPTRRGIGLYVVLGVTACALAAGAFALRGSSTSSPDPAVPPVTEAPPAPVVAPVAVVASPPPVAPAPPAPVPMPAAVPVPPPVVANPAAVVAPTPEPVAPVPVVTPPPRVVSHVPVSRAPDPRPIRRPVLEPAAPPPAPVIARPVATPPPSPTTTPPPPSGTSALSVALACSSDNACMIRALAGRAHTDRELALLAVAYRASGQRSQAVATMRSYLDQYPTGPSSSRFRAFLSEQE